MFREWVYIISILIVMFGFVIGIIQLILKIKKKVLKVGLISIFIISLLLFIPIIYLVGAFCCTPSHVVLLDGKKYVAYVNGFVRTYVYYYDYKNIFVVGRQKRIVEYCGYGSFDPIENKYGYEYEVWDTTYYDEEGRIISINE